MSEEVYYELALVCLQLHHDEEAIRTWRMMQPGPARNRLESVLARRGLIEPPVRRTRREPAAEARAPRAQLRDPLDPPPSLADHLHDAFRFLTQERMPLLVSIAMLLFPLVIGVGGFLTSGGSPLLLPAIAAVPGICVLGTVGALGRRILVDGAGGREEPPSLPDLSTLAREAARFYTDGAILGTVLLGPSGAMFLLGVPWVSILPVLVLGSFLLPMALALREVREDWKVLSLRLVLTAIGRTASRYVGIAVAFWVMILPAVAAFLATPGTQLWLRTAAVGPFLVLPVFTTARMLGTFLDAQRIALGRTLGEPRRAAHPPRPRPVAKPRLSARPVAPAAIRTQSGASAVAYPGLRREAAPSPGFRRAPVQPARPEAPRAEKPRGEKQGKEPRASLPEGLDLPPGLLGGVIVSGSDRERLGAAARRN
ncbi:MAG: hypothetical protein Fur0037_01380 [Planctomycetota bacterium]